MTDPKDSDPAEGSRDTIEKELQRQENPDKPKPERKGEPNDQGKGKKT